MLLDGAADIGERGGRKTAEVDEQTVGALRAEIGEELRFRRPAPTWPKGCIRTRRSRAAGRPARLFAVSAELLRARRFRRRRTPMMRFTDSDAEPLGIGARVRFALRIKDIDERKDRRGALIMTAATKDEVAMVGMGCAQFAERRAVGREELMVNAHVEALRHAGIVPDGIGAAWYSSHYDDIGAGKSGISFATFDPAANGPGRYRKTPAYSAAPRMTYSF